MNTFLPFFGFLLVMSGWTWYLALIPAEKVPQRPLSHISLIAFGMVLAVGTAVFSPAIGPLVFALLALLLGGFFYWLLAQATLPDGTRIVSVGDSLPEFEAPNDTGQLIKSEQWRGERLLLKFFRGHW